MKVVVQEYDEFVPVGDLAEHPDNPRRGQDDAVAESIEENDFFGAILVQKSTKLIVAGNTRFRAMRDAGAVTIPGFWVDCDDVEAKRILLADNRVGDLAFYQDDQLLALLQEIAEESGSIKGTGYDDYAMDLLALGLAEIVVPEMEPPDSFDVIDPEQLDIDYRCPSCQYEWSGSPKPGAPKHEPA